FTFFEGLNANLGLILAASARNTRTSAVTRRWAHQEMKAHYHRVARELTDKDNGWHLGAVHMKAEQVLDFRIEDMAARMRSWLPNYGNSSRSSVRPRALDWPREGDPRIKLSVRMSWSCGGNLNSAEAMFEKAPILSSCEGCSLCLRRRQ
ncbi:uncharacterized protein B0H18DRAFT_1132630, partial [Fomitopsis serialis]|uniref:uncharacterized protein n=1 Tax=Fomitopsis serialis TaxID=139415 RepID=UPI0020084A12